MSTVTFYGHWRSGSSQRVRIALHVREIPYEYVPIDLGRREQESPGFAKVNAWGQVPVVMLRGETLTQSQAIIGALDDVTDASGPRLAPVDPLQRRRADEIVAFVATMVQPFQLPGATRRRLVEAFGFEPDASDASVACSTFVREHLGRALEELERLVRRSAGRFSVGDTVSTADCFVIPQLISAAAAGVDVNVFPTLSRVFEHGMRVPAIASTHPDLQPDAPQARAGGGPDGLDKKDAVATQSHVGGAMAQAMDYKERDALVTRYLIDEVNQPIPGIDVVRDEAFARFGPVATKISAIDVCLFLRWLVQVTAARRIVEVGVFTGSSSLAMLDGMPAGGRLVGFDVSPDYTAVAQAAWRAAGVTERAELRLVDAASGLKAMIAEPDWAGQVDLAYVDGLNTQYLENFEDLLPLLAPRGIIVFDNTLWKGRVPNRAIHDEQTDHLRHLNDTLHADPRVHATVIRIGDGLTLVTRASH